MSRHRDWALSFPCSTVPNAYLFLTVTLLFSLPLLTAYYSVNQSFFVTALIPYLVLSALGTMLIVRRSLNRRYTNPAEAEKVISSLFTDSSTDSKSSTSSSFITRLNTVVPSYVAVGIVTSTIVTYALLRYLLASSYPTPLPSSVSLVEPVYMALLIACSIFSFSRALYALFPILRRILQLKKYAIMTSILAVGFAVVYSLVVNGLLIVGVNTQANMPSLTNSYPFFYPPMAPGTLNPLVDLVYFPTMVMQPIYQVNFIIIPFEVVFTALLSLLVASNVAMAHSLISTDALRGCFAKGAALSTGGSVLGLTATCPTCLVPAFVTAILGGIGICGVSSAQILYSSIYGVTLPPLISVLTLAASLVYLSKAIKRKGS